MGPDTAYDEPPQESGGLEVRAADGYIDLRDGRAPGFDLDLTMDVAEARQLIEDLQKAVSEIEGDEK